MLKISRVNKQYGSNHVLNNVSLDLMANETIVILGPSGCGKTTLLKLVSGMEMPDSGTIGIGGVSVQKPSTDIAFILQNFGLLPWKTNLHNVALGLKIKGIDRKTRNRIACQHLSNLGLEGREKDYPAVLSGGEQQRVAIARAYASDPKLLLMDEPFSSLDAITRESLQDTLLESWRTLSIPYLLVTHSVEEAVYLGQRILILADHPSEVKKNYENPGFASPDYRQSNDYYELVRLIRKDMGELW
ncbi:ABC transporter ATP-binding protein [bacterium]|nr:ABC transporter ATP-binding protein [bacterium]